MKIGKLNKEDIKELAILMFELYKKWDKIDPIDRVDKKWFCSREHYAYIYKLLKDKNCLVLIAEENKKIVGYIISFIQERQPFLKKVGYISETYTLPSMRGKGIAKQLVKYTFDWFKKYNLSWYVVSTHSLDKEANSFWKNKGFKEFNKVLKKKS